MTRLALLFACILCPSAMGQGLKTPYVSPYFPPVVQAGPYAPMSGFGGGVHFGNSHLGMYSSFPTPYAYSLHALNPYAFGYNAGIVTNAIPMQVLVAPAPLPLPLPNLAPATTLNRDIAEAEFTAKLDLVFPAPAEVRFDGTLVEGSDASEVTLTSPPLKVGVSHIFNIRATWSVEGRKYQVERAVTVKAGERSRLTIVSGDPVK
jgi:uncharacterized protein (TIGR03000 family)